MNERCTYDPLKELLAYYNDAEPARREAIDTSVFPVEQRLRQRIIDGEKVGIERDLDEAMTTMTPLEIINTVLLEGMKTVGELFGSGQMQLPFVLQSAETMKAAVGYLEPFMDRVDGMQKGVIVLATVKGDVHDIGKNLVDIILTNNGYKVVNLGIKCPVETMLHAADEHRADALGMSGLLVKSTLIMKENLQLMNGRGLTIPVILGGAALTRRYVEQELRSLYRGELAYANDAFDGLRFMESIVESRRSLGRTSASVSMEFIRDAFAAERQKYLACLRKLSEEQFYRPGAFGAWSVKDTLAHINGWLEVTVDRLAAIARHDESFVYWYGDEATDSMNVRFVAARRNASRRILLDEFRWFSELIDTTLATVSLNKRPESLTREGMVKMLRENLDVHLASHVDRILIWQKSESILDSSDEMQRRIEAEASQAEKESIGGASLETAITLRTVQENRAEGAHAIVVNREEKPSFIIRSAIEPIESPPKPPFFGSRIVSSIDLNDVFTFINPVALIRGQWQIRKGKRSEAEYNRQLEQEVTPLIRRLEAQCIEHGLLEPRVVYGYFPCSSDGDDLIIYRPHGLSDADLLSVWPANEFTRSNVEPWMRFHFPRQGNDRYLCISDYFLPTTAERLDVIACHIVTIGARATEHASTLFASDRYQDYLYFHGFAVESAEALAEYWHKVIRTELGIAGDDADEVTRLFSQGYRGSRYSFGYPACPNLEDQKHLFTLLSPDRIGVTLTDEFQLVPEQSTSAIIVHHPKAKYFNVR